MYSKVALRIEGLKDSYTIDTDGVVYNETKGKALAGTSISKNNRYVKIHLDKFHPLHRLVAMHFIPNSDPSRDQVNHKDGDRNNNAASNLEWVTSSENVRHAYATSLKSNDGELNPFSVLTETDVINIWKLRNTKLTARQIRDRLGLKVGVDAVKSVRSGKNWSSVTSKLG